MAKIGKKNNKCFCSSVKSKGVLLFYGLLETETFDIDANIKESQCTKKKNE